MLKQQQKYWMRVYMVDPTSKMYSNDNKGIITMYLQWQINVHLLRYAFCEALRFWIASGLSLI